MIKVKLTAHELIVCRIIGNMRTLTSRFDTTTYTTVEQNLSIDEDGIVGEFAFCKHWNIFFNPEVRYRNHTFDAMLKNQRVDIKTTRRKDGRLMAPLKINPDVDVFVLGILDGDEVIFPGYATAKMLYQEKNHFQPYQNHTVYALEQKDLAPWKDQT